MRAFAIDEFGQPGSIREVPEPEPAEGEVLVRVKVAGMNATDIFVMAGYMQGYLEHLWPLIIGIDASGVVEKVGPGVEHYREGDEVYGFDKLRVVGRGTMADLVALHGTRLSHKPRTITWEEAAVVGHSSLTAVAAVEDIRVKSGDRIVLLGGTGGVGSFATQLASERGAEVVAVTRPEYTVYARSMGAAGVVDYTHADPAHRLRELYPDGVDAVIDLVGLPELLASMSALVRPGGRVTSTVLPPDVEGFAARGIDGKLTVRFSAEHRFAEIAIRIAEGSLRVPAIQSFTFDRVEDAIALQATRHVRGKIAVQIGLAPPPSRSSVPSEASIA
jgi:NADPH:quinone reductase-like Zn-dependent oxidoreductase